MNKHQRIELGSKQETINELCDEGSLDLSYVNADDLESVEIGPLKIVDDDYIETEDYSTVSAVEEDEIEQDDSYQELSDAKYHIYQNKDLKIHLFTEDDLIRENNFIQLTKKIKYHETDCQKKVR